MRYLGGKSRIAKDLTKAIGSVLGPWAIIGEPFMGGGAMTLELAKTFRQVVATDAHPDLVLMWQALQSGWRPRTNISETEYENLRASESSPLRGFAGFAGSFGGKWFGGYARGSKPDGTPRNYLAESLRNIERALPYLGDVYLLEARDYRLFPVESVDALYLDPPYAGTTGYKGGFDSEAFWTWASSLGLPMFISEYAAPKGWITLWETKLRQQTNRDTNARDVRTERLFWNGR